MFLSHAIPIRSDQPISDRGRAPTTDFYPFKGKPLIKATKFNLSNSIASLRRSVQTSEDPHFRDGAPTLFDEIGSSNFGGMR